MAIGRRTATSGTVASGATGTITIPTGTTPLDMVIVVIGNAGTAGPTAPSGWTSAYAVSAGSGQFTTVWWAFYTPRLTLTFTNAASIAAFVCQSYTGVNVLEQPGSVVAATNTGNNTTLPTGAPTTGFGRAEFEALCYVWTSNATITTTAAGSTIERTQANGTGISAAIGYNNTTILGASTTVTAFSHTLSANNNRKTGVGFLIKPYVGSIQSVGHPFYF